MKKNYNFVTRDNKKIADGDLIWYLNFDIFHHAAFIKGYYDKQYLVFKFRKNAEAYLKALKEIYPNYPFKKI